MPNYKAMARAASKAAYKSVRSVPEKADWEYSRAAASAKASVAAVKESRIKKRLTKHAVYGSDKMRSERAKFDLGYETTQLSRAKAHEGRVYYRGIRRARRVSQAESVAPLLLGCIGAYLLWNHFKDDAAEGVADAAKESVSEYVSTFIKETTSSVTQGGINLVSGGADAVISGVSSGVHNVGRDGAYSDMAAAAGRGEGFEASYETHLNKYPLGLGVPAGLLTSFSDWQSKYTGVDPIEGAAKTGAAKFGEKFTSLVFPGPVISAVARPLWDKYILRR